MREPKLALFGHTRELEARIEEFLDQISQAAMAFEQGVSVYVDRGPGEDVEQKLELITRLEHRGDDLQRELVTTLLSRALIPDSRADVLSLLDDLDELLDVSKASFTSLTLEHPLIPEDHRSDVRDLASSAARAAECAVLAARAYFRDVSRLRDHLHKIHFYESEVDRLSARIRRRVFSSEVPLERRMHLTAIIREMALLSDEAEKVGDRLAIYAAKRTL